MISVKKIKFTLFFLFFKPIANFMKIYNLVCTAILVVFFTSISSGQKGLTLGKVGFSIGDYKDKATVKSTSTWGVNVSFEYFWARHLSSSMNINTFSTRFSIYNPKIKAFSNVKDFFGGIELDLKYYPLRVTHSPYVGIGTGAHICDCYGFTYLEKIREGAGGFDLNLKTGYQFILNEAIAFNIGAVYSFARPGKSNYLERINGIFQVGFLIN